MSLMWSTGLIVVRSIIGLAHLWGHQLLFGFDRREGPMTDAAKPLVAAAPAKDFDDRGLEHLGPPGPLRARPRHTIDILDPSALCQCRFSRFVRRWYRCPSFATDPCGYLAFLGERLRLGDTTSSFRRTKRFISSRASATALASAWLSPCPSSTA